MFPSSTTGNGRNEDKNLKRNFGKEKYFHQKKGKLINNDKKLNKKCTEKRGFLNFLYSGFFHFPFLFFDETNTIEIGNFPELDICESIII